MPKENPMGGEMIPPPAGVFKIKNNGSYRGNLGPVEVGGVGRDCSREVMFFFPLFKGHRSTNLMEA